MKPPPLLPGPLKRGADRAGEMLLLLRALEPRFVRCVTHIAEEWHGRPLEGGEIQWGGFEVDGLTKVSALADSDGLQFLCPKCFQANRGPIGTHIIQVFFKGHNAPEHIGIGSDGSPHRWSVIGNDFYDLTLSPSIQTMANCKWHGWIRHGAVEDA